jgi:5-methylcytosine-specific restriction endonuclease McrA
MNKDNIIDPYIASLNYKEYKPMLMKRYKGCQACRSDERARLIIHHVTYRRYGREKITDLRLLCRNCHDEFHKHIKGSDPDLRMLTDLFIKRNGIWNNY